MTTAQDEMIQRITGYIQHNARKDAPSIRDLVQQGHAQISGQLASMSEAQGAFKPAPEEWSALELLAHVVTAKRGVARMCGRLAKGEQLTTFGGEGEEQDGITRGGFASLAEARAAMDAAHDELLSFVDGALTGADETARYRHFLFGELNCREWAVFQRVHDGDHANQIEKVKAAPGYPAG